MTTLEDKLFAALVVEQNFRLARSDLLIQNVVQNGRGSLEDCQCFLSDDGKSVAAYANFSDDECTIFSTFELAEPISEESFDPNVWARRLSQGD
jgi:hypothetical protein